MIWVILVFSFIYLFFFLLQHKKILLTILIPTLLTKRYLHYLQYNDYNTIRTLNAILTMWCLLTILNTYTTYKNGTYTTYNTYSDFSLPSIPYHLLKMIFSSAKIPWYLHKWCYGHGFLYVALPWHNNSTRQSILIFIIICFALKCN